MLSAAPSATASLWTRCPNMVQVAFEVYWLRPEPNTTLWVKVDVPSCENGVRLAPPRSTGKPYTTTCLLPSDQRLQWWVGIEREREAAEWTVTPRKLYTKGVTFVCHVLWGGSPNDTALHYMQTRMEDWQKNQPTAAPTPTRSTAPSGRRALHDPPLRSAFHAHGGPAARSASALSGAMTKPAVSPRHVLCDSTIIAEDPQEPSFAASDLSSICPPAQASPDQAAVQADLPEGEGPPRGAESHKEGSPSSEEPSERSDGQATPTGPGDKKDRKWGWWNK